MARIFLSHASSDKPTVRRIADALRAAGHRAWLDEEEILVGESIPAAVERALREADFVVLCLSKAAENRGWIEAERDATLMQQFHERKERILPVRLEDVTPPYLVASLAYVDLFPDNQSFERGIARLTQSLKAYEARHAQGAFDVGSAVVLGLDPTAVAAGKRDVADEQVDRTAPPQLRVRPDVDASRLRFAPTVASSSSSRAPDRRPSRTWSWKRWVVGASAGALAAGGALWGWLGGKATEPFEMVHVEGGTVNAEAVPGFRIAKTELPQSVWEATTGVNPSDPHFGRGPRYPVNNVTWDEVIDTANKLSLCQELTPCYERRGDRWRRLDCTGYRLMTDIEWNYLKMRTGVPKSLCTTANVADRSLRADPDLLARLEAVRGFDTVDCDDHFTLLAPVGSLAPDALGIYDLEGNVAEWIWKGTATDPATPTVRGSSFLGGGQDDASQQSLGREMRNPAIGVRYARDAR